MSLFNEEGRVLISPSRLKTWIDCPMKWKAVYVDSIKIAPSPAMAFGTAIHRALEAHHRDAWYGSARPVAALVQVFREALVEETAKGVVLDSDEMAAQATVLIGLYLDKFGAERVSATELSLTAPVLDPETGEDLGAELVGVIDLITADGCVVDIKTSSRTSELFELVVSHSLQLDAYRYLLRQAGREPSEMSIRLLVRKKQPAIEAFAFPLGKDSTRLLEACRRYISFVRSMEKPTPRPGFFCGDGCPAYRACRAFHGLGAA